MSDHWDALSHVCGTTLFLDDLPFPAHGLHLLPVDARVAHATHLHIDARAASALPGVLAVLTAADIPGENQIGSIFQDEPLLAEKDIHYAGQPLALVVATSVLAAERAARLVNIECEELPALTDPREAAKRGELIGQPRTFQLGQSTTAWPLCAHLFSGSASCPGQEHLYLETQGAIAWPHLNGGLRVFSSTQGPSAVQRTIARILGLPLNAVEVEANRLGGGFGGKEDQASPWAAMAALAAWRFGRPAKLVLDRARDMRMTGKRHPYLADFKLGLDENLRILAYEVDFYQNAGAAADLSPAVLERTLFHATGSYFIPHVTATARSCRTNLPPNTAFRGFGAPQGMFVMEAAIARAAESLGIPAWHIQRANLLEKGQIFSYGQRVSSSMARRCWETMEQRFSLKAREAALHASNKERPRKVKGMAVMPLCFGISFTKTHMNQASALVHVYTDGSVSISSGAVEMGQGVHSKLRALAASLFTLPLARIRVETTNTTRNANTSPSAASATADLNGQALTLACTRLIERLLNWWTQKCGDQPGEWRLAAGHICKSPGHSLSFAALAEMAYLERISLSEQAFYATPGLFFDAEKESGHPFAYHVHGAALTQVTLDTLLGTYRIDSVQIVHDLGRTALPGLDRGQIEGALLQGIGWLTCEDLVFDQAGILKSHALATYKVPDMDSAPAQLEIHCLEEEPNPLSGSKAVGEPPLMYGIGTYFALRNALHHAGAALDNAIEAPMSCERCLRTLHTE